MGNFRITEMPWATNYIWSALQFDDGSIFTFRQWYDQSNQPLLNLGRHSYSTPNNPTTYGFGQSVVFTPLKTWTSPVSNRNFPVYASVSSEFGTWYYSPVYPDYEMPFGYPPYGTSGLDIWEAPCLTTPDPSTVPWSARPTSSYPTASPRHSRCSPDRRLLGPLPSAQRRRYGGQAGVFKRD